MDETSVAQFVDDVLIQGIKRKASDLHFEPFEDYFQIRYRVNGVMEQLDPLRTVLAPSIISRIKVMADLNISEHRLPQDGRMKIMFEQHAVDLRVSTLPTQSGESVVVRILDKSVVHLDLERLGISERVLNSIRTTIVQPNGIFLVTGPTGSGKTTTLYSALNEINDGETKILTVEDPVEYEIEGVIQTAINPEIGLDFPDMLRAFLRQDPDKILVGEIRDLETAQIAVRASLTGHFVMSTLHTNDAAGAVIRMIDMGVEPSLLAASLRMVLAQRLLRSVCPHCREWKPLRGEDESVLELNAFDFILKKTAHAKGCCRCHQSGYTGRVGLFELLEVNDALGELISGEASLVEIRKAAISNGMRVLRLCGLDALVTGKTTIEEVLKYT